MDFLKTFDLEPHKLLITNFVAYGFDEISFTLYLFTLGKQETLFQL